MEHTYPEEPGHGPHSVLLLYGVLLRASAPSPSFGSGAPWKEHGLWVQTLTLLLRLCPWGQHLTS